MDQAERRHLGGGYASPRTPFASLTSFPRTQWFKPLNPWQVNAVKSLVSLDALSHERHPLRSPGGVRNLELFVGKSL